MLAEVYDLECLVNLFTYTGYCRQEKKWHQFVIHQSRNDYKLLMDHLRRDKLVMIGFNNESYDYPLLHHLMKHYGEYIDMDPLDLSQKIYAKSQQIIDMEFSAIADKNKYIYQIDLYRIWHYNNKARHTSLKDLEFAMRMPDVEDMPIHHTTWCKASDISTVLSYNKNDVLATNMFLDVTIGKTDYPLYKGENKIKIREQIQHDFHIPCINYPDVKIGEQLMLKLYAQKIGSTSYEVKQKGGTKRNEIRLKDCIPHWTRFETKEFNSILTKFKNTVIKDIKGEFKESLVFHGQKLDYGTGGLHSCIAPGVYSADDYWMILDEDIGSLYPSLAIQLGLYPQHLGPEFLESYDKDIVSVRLAEKVKPKKERNMVIMKGFKLAANGVYGKSGEESSFLYDPLYTMKTTIGGQMFLSMWTEKLVAAIPEIRFIQHNTDGITYLLPRKDLEKAKKVGQEMSDITGLYIEDNIYTKFVVRDVNNYLALYENGDVKYKGCFEIDKEFHKDPSMRIVPIAVSNYFLKGIPVEETVKNHQDIFDFCLRMKLNANSSGVYKYIDKDTGLLKEKSLSKTTRYYISEYGGIILKKLPKSTNGVNVGFSCTLFNTYEKKEMKDYRIDYRFYVKEAKKIINPIMESARQLSLF